LNVCLDAKAISLLGAAESGICVGGDAGGVFGPAMILSESLFVGRESNLAVRERFCRIAIKSTPTRTAFGGGTLSTRLMTTQSLNAGGVRPQ
jgi:hypothetical protein